MTRINQEIQKHDKSLFVAQARSGMLQVWRKAEKWSAADITNEDEEVSSPTQFIFALTDDWTVNGSPVDRGIEPIMNRIQELDQWSKDSLLDQIRKDRERRKELRDRERRNEMKARAYDMRKDFAKATNEINTSTLEKVDRRRSNGNC